MKYSDEWKQTQTKEAFVALLLKKYHITLKTAVRRYYDVRKNPASGTVPSSHTPSLPPSLPFYLDTEEEKPVDRFKMLMISDMKRYKMKITVSMLKQYGFTSSEINWLNKNKHIVLEG